LAVPRCPDRRVAARAGAGQDGDHGRSVRR
jgi:hypothetical protein